MSALNVVLPLASTIVSLLFAALVLDQWWQRRHAFQLVWGVGLLFYGIATATEFIGGAFGWSEGLYRAWYLVGAFFVAAYLGAGTIYLLSKTRFGYFAAASIVLGGLFSLAATSKYPGSSAAGAITLGAAVVAALAIALTTWRWREWQGHVAMAALVAGSLVVAALVLTARVGGPALDPTTHVPVASGFPGYLRVASVPFNAGGGLALVFGALYSAYIYMPKLRVVDSRFGLLAIVPNFVASLPGAFAALAQNRLNSRVPATLLIALGSLIPGTTSSLNRFGVTWSFFLGELLGVLLIFAGFLVSEEVFRSFRFGPYERARLRT
ncbi:MAG TPA: hypothetical protein VFB69_01975 [Candidatus Dormibacteraeota bacterium]|nr:hypothetical protein [Candidatus Dormibacteraeota bacterium]